MRILNFGSINIDRVYRVPHIVRPGETLTSASYRTFAGGKGANQSVALARAGARVCHAGRIGRDGLWLRDKLARAGVEVTHLAVGEEPTGHAVIQVDDRGQNSIVLFPGANHGITVEAAQAVLDAFAPGDVLLLQNEISQVPHLIAQGRRRGLRVCFNPAPFAPQVRDYPLTDVDLLVVNQTEAAGVAAVENPAGDQAILDALTQRLPGVRLVLTQGDKGVLYREKGRTLHVSAVPVKTVDTTAAGDTFIGYFLAAQAAGMDVEASLRRACRAAALCVSRSGAMDSIPSAEEVG
jgi:ribokinase